MLLCELPGFKYRADKVSRQALLTLPQLDRLLREFFLETYHRRAHGETQMAPAECWEKGAFLPRTPESLEQLDLLLLTSPRQERCAKIHASVLKT